MAAWPAAQMDSEKLRVLTELSSVCTPAPRDASHAQGLPGLAGSTSSQMIMFCFMSLHHRGSESAFGFVGAQVPEYHQAVFPEGRWDSGDVRHYGRVLLHGSAQLDEQRPGESGPSAFYCWQSCLCLALVSLQQSVWEQCSWRPQEVLVKMDAQSRCYSTACGSVYGTGVC